MNVLHSIFQACAIDVSGYEPVHGGDINTAYCIYSNNTKYFLKTNSNALYPGMFAKEAAGLLALQQNSTMEVPAVIKHSNTGDQQYLLLQWINKGVPGKNFWEDFGRSLALIHHQQQNFFGWEEDNYIGSLPQKNTKHTVWHSFYAECRILPLVKQLFDTGNFSKQEIVAAERLCNKLDILFPAEQPALLHGDLWAGNFMVNEQGNAAVYDPAVYFGHREMDIGMSLLFGGFDQQFYAAYNNACPLHAGWQQRIQLTQLYPLLVHAVLFGGHYINAAKNIISLY